MTENKTPLSKYMVMLILILGSLIMAGGYALFYQSQKKIVQKDREYSLEKQKALHATENYNELQKKYNDTAQDLKQVTQDYEAILQKHQECKEKQEELQTKFDELQQTSERIKKELQEAQSHPVHLLTPPQEKKTEDAPLSNHKKNN